MRACVRVCVCVEGGGKVLRESKFNMYKGTCAGGLQGSRVGVCSWILYVSHREGGLSMGVLLVVVINFILMIIKTLHALKIDYFIFLYFPLF